MHFPFLLPNGGDISYPAFVAALAKPGAAITASLTADKAHAWHMASCIPGEVGELFAALTSVLKGYRHATIDRENVIEELGDIEFYMEGLRNLFGFTRDTTLMAATLAEADTFDLPGTAAEVFDATKRWAIYNKDLDSTALMVAMGNLELALIYVRSSQKISLNAVLSANIDKLGKRYESLSYSDAAAQARADKVSVQ